jgi:hypothetical protein
MGYLFAPPSVVAKNHFALVMRSPSSIPHRAGSRRGDSWNFAVPNHQGKACLSGRPTLLIRGIPGTGFGTDLDLTYLDRNAVHLERHNIPGRDWFLIVDRARSKRWKLPSAWMREP